MSWEYSCPRCQTMLNPGRSIVLEMTRGDVDCLIGLHPKPGKYQVYLPPNVFTEDGTRWDFACPLCKESLATAGDPNLCELDLSVDGSQVKILFSCIAGEHATFILYQDRLKEKYGKDAPRYHPEQKTEIAEQR